MMFFDNFSSKFIFTKKLIEKQKNTGKIKTSITSTANEILIKKKTN